MTPPASRTAAVISLRDWSFVECVAAGLDRLLARWRPAPGRLLRRRERAQRRREIRLPEHLADRRDLPARIIGPHRPGVRLACRALGLEVVVQELVHREAVRQLDRRLEDVRERLVPYFASAIAAESTAAGSVAPSGPLPGIASLPANICGRAPLAAQVPAR